VRLTSQSCEAFPKPLSGILINRESGRGAHLSTLLSVVDLRRRKEASNLKSTR